jgi:hypothetical protein
VGSKIGLLLSRRYVDLVCEDFIDERFGDGEVESDEQLVQGLSVATDEHGHAVGSVHSGCDAAYRFDDADGDVTVVDHVCDVRKGRWTEGDPLT